MSWNGLTIVLYEFNLFKFVILYKEEYYFTMNLIYVLQNKYIV